MYRKLIPFFIILVAILYGVAITMPTQMQIPTKSGQIRYVALGDSYTYGEGARREEAWPYLLTEDLKKNGVDIILEANLGKNSWTTQQVIDFQLPEYQTLKPTFATLLVGVNDWNQKVPVDVFRGRYAYLLDQMLKELPDHNHLLVMTLPNYSATTTGLGIVLDKHITDSVTEFNDVITEEAQKRGLQIIDLYQPTLAMEHDKSLVATDGLHPSAKEYAIWEHLIYPVAFNTLAK